jgi:hypothetical protein
VSYSTNRRDALNPDLPTAQRISHARSCAMLVSQKYRVHRSVILDLVRRSCGVDLTASASESGIVEAIATLDRIKADGPGPPSGDLA